MKQQQSHAAAEASRPSAGERGNQGISGSSGEGVFAVIYRVAARLASAVKAVGRSGGAKCPRT